MFIFDGFVKSEYMENTNEGLSDCQLLITDIAYCLDTCMPF